MYLHTYVEMQSIQKEAKGELVAVDFLRPLPRSSRGVKHILVCIDVFSKAVHLYPIMRPTTKAVLKILLQKYIPIHGKMKRILSDQGVQFQSEVWNRILRENGIQPILTSIRHPQGNLAERVNKELGKYLRIYCHNQHNKWAEYLPFFEKAINENYSEATSYTQIEIEQDRQPDRFWKRYVHTSVNQNLQIPLSIKTEHANRRIMEKDNKRIERFNRTHKLQKFNVGEKVLLKTNPIGKRIDNTAKEFFRLYDGPVSYTHLDVYKRQIK